MLETNFAPGDTLPGKAGGRPRLRQLKDVSKLTPVFLRAQLCRKLTPVLLVGLFLAGCGQPNAYVAPPPPKVVVAKPLQKPAVQYVEATGNTAPLKNVDLEARVQGFLEKINYQDGATVKQGTLLFEIQRDTYEAQLAQAKASLASAQAGVTNADINISGRLPWGDRATSPPHRGRSMMRRPRSIKPRLP